jgi:hypothetical protein
MYQVLLKFLANLTPTFCNTAKYLQRAVVTFPQGRQTPPVRTARINTAMDTKAVKLLTLIGGFLCKSSPPHLHSALKMMSVSQFGNEQSN